MRFTIRLQNSSCMASVENLLRVAGEAEDLGYYGVSVQDHLISNSAVSTCGIHGTHAGDDRVVFEPLQVLAFLAGQTKRVRLVTAVLVLPTRNAILMAKQLATLDVLSNGRLIVGVGVGATPGEHTSKDRTQDLRSHADVAAKEFATYGVTGNRGAIADEALAVLHAMWEQGRTEHVGKRYRIEGVEIFPKPVQRPRPPIWIGGRSEMAQERAVRLADGWCPSQISPSDFAQGIAHIREFAERTGAPMPRDFGVNIFVALDDTDEKAFVAAKDALGERFKMVNGAPPPVILAGSPSTVREQIKRFADAGVNVMDVKFVPANVRRTVDAMRLFAEQVAPSV